MFWISHTDVMDQPHRCNANNQLATGRGNSSEWISHTDVMDQPHRCNANNQLATGRGNSSEWISHTDVMQITNSYKDPGSSWNPICC